MPILGYFLNPKKHEVGWGTTPVVLETTLKPSVQSYTPKRTTLSPPLNQEKYPSSSKERVWKFVKKGASQIKMVNDGMGPAGNGNLGLLASFNPIVQKVLSQMALPKFGGKPEDWPAFRKLWGKCL